MGLDWSDFTLDDLDQAAKRDVDFMERNVVAEMLEAAEGNEFPVQLTDSDIWNNYCDEELYLLDKKVREYIKKMVIYKKHNKGFRTSVPMVFAWIFGRPCTPSDGRICRKLHRLLEYYAQHVTGVTTINGKKVEKAYKFSTYGGSSKRPLSIKLRMELNEQETGAPVNKFTFTKFNQRAPERKPRTDGPDDGQGDA